MNKLLDLTFLTFFNQDRINNSIGQIGIRRKRLRNRTRLIRPDFEYTGVLIKLFIIIKKSALLGNNSTICESDTNSICTLSNSW